MNDAAESNIIALLTDFGTKDYFVGAMKGAILSINPQAKIIDITHEIEPQDIAAASFTLRACYRNFPAKTIFVAVVDPGVGSNRKAILVETDDYYFVAPDNELLSFVFNETDDFKVFELTNENYFASQISQTFHGRDVFAPAAAHLSKNAAARLFGAETKKFVRLPENKPHERNGAIVAEIIYADRFGNLITNLTAKDLPAKFALAVNETLISRQYRYFAEAEKGELFVIFGSAGFLEIAAFRDSAQRLLKVRIGQGIIVTNA